MAREKSKPTAPKQPGGPGPWLRRFPPRWLVMTLALLLSAGALWAVAGDKTGAVFATFAFWVFVLPVVLAAGMLGLLLTEPFARRGIFDNSPWPTGYRMLMATALGLGTFALATLVLGTAHLIEPTGNPWPLLAIPLAAVATGYLAARRFVAGFDRSLFTRRAHRGEWLLLPAAVPVAVLLIAATFPPGSLWHTEAYGFDVMEYHLQLPREYALNNSTAPVTHNVYSYFPSNVEMLYLLLMQFAKVALGADRATGYVGGTYPAQFCHTLMMLLAAGAVALIPIGGDKDKPWLGMTGRTVAVLLFLGVPWTLVTGSLAYNEAGMLLFGTLALGAAWDAGAATDRRARGILVGLLLGLAVGCKMTAGVFFALPVALLYLVRGVKDKTQFRLLLLATTVAAGVYLPWALRAAAYSGGNPVFPLATSLLPRDGWTAEQSARFDKGHATPENLRPPAARLRALADNSLLDGQWSVQPYPMFYTLLNGNEAPAAQLDTWWKRLGLLWLAVPLALAGAFITRPGRTEAGLLLAMLGVQIFAWLFATHAQGRFLLPAAVPLALLVGRGVQGLHSAREAIPVAALRIVAGTIVALHALAAAFILLPETGLLGGAMLPQHNAAPPPAPPIGELFTQVYNMAEVIEHPDGSVEIPPQKILFVGESRAWKYIGDVDYFTVFDNHPFVQALEDPKKAVAWLRTNHVQYVVVNWSEVDRLRASYGFDPAVTRESIAALVPGGGGGVEEMHTQLGANVTVLRVAE